MIAGLSCFYGEKNITRSDWTALLCALGAIVLWYFTHNPLWAVFIISAIEYVAIFPTVRKAWNKPREEALSLFAIDGAQFALSLFAQKKLALITVFYPAVIIVMNMTMVLLLLYRRRVVKT